MYHDGKGTLQFQSFSWPACGHVVHDSCLAEYHIDCASLDIPVACMACKGPLPKAPADVQLF
mgnify:CR=1 FL=1